MIIPGSDRQDLKNLKTACVEKSGGSDETQDEDGVPGVPRHYIYFIGSECSEPRMIISSCEKVFFQLLFICLPPCFV
jgi:hypothetical protein